VIQISRRVFFFTVLLLCFNVREANAYLRAKPCNIEWGSTSGQPESIATVLKRYGDKTHQSFMSRLDLHAKMLRLGPARTYRCDDAYDDLEARLSRQFGIYLDAHSGFIILFNSLAEANAVDARWVREWELGVVKSESDFSKSCFGGLIENPKVRPSEAFTLAEYLDRVSKRLHRKILLPDGVIPESLGFAVLPTKTVCAAGLWNGAVLALNVLGYHVVADDGNVWRAQYRR
jgi:hypothetical protein